MDTRQAPLTILQSVPDLADRTEDSPLPCTALKKIVHLARMQGHTCYRAAKHPSPKTTSATEPRNAEEIRILDKCQDKHGAYSPSRYALPPVGKLQLPPPLRDSMTPCQPVPMQSPCRAQRKPKYLATESRALRPGP